ncbi:DUF5085 family protein [Alloscardovia venturai]|uniref:DUF5085 family protein n=1 Tax=Alloscardovia venturai TaxID=1769421 RepID=A0ABW2Y408_9BIFI
MKLITEPGVYVSEHFEAENVLRFHLKFHYSQFSKKLEDCVIRARKYSATIIGSFYSFNNVPQDEIVDTEFFFITEETYLDIPGTIFSSYFELNNLISIDVTHDYEIGTEIAYAKLINTYHANNMQINSPFYHFPHIPIDDSNSQPSMTIATAYAF